MNKFKHRWLRWQKYLTKNMLDIVYHKQKSKKIKTNVFSFYCHCFYPTRVQYLTQLCYTIFWRDFVFQIQMCYTNIVYNITHLKSTNTSFIWRKFIRPMGIISLYRHLFEEIKKIVFVLSPQFRICPDHFFKSGWKFTSMIKLWGMSFSSENV